MGYYSERIQGSNLQKFKFRLSIGGAILMTIMGFGVMYTPSGKKWVKRAKEGYFDPTPEQLERENQQRLMMFQSLSFESRETKEARKRISFTQSNYNLFGNPGRYGTDPKPETVEAPTESQN